MKPIRKLILLIKELGISNLTSYGIYQFLLRSGALRRTTPVGGHPVPAGLDLFPFQNMPFPIPTREQLTAALPASTPLPDSILIFNGKYRPFSGDISELKFEIPHSMQEHWTSCTTLGEGEDIKAIWEPARFSWSLDLGRSYLLSQDERYAEIFWESIEDFIRVNPVNQGANWASAQEVAIRMISWMITTDALQNARASTQARCALIARSIWQHACRIPATLDYARAQRNNHLLSEALGMITAGIFFSEISEKSSTWLALGFREFEKAILDQIHEDGTYAQHSVNYHRMMLQLALLFSACAKKQGHPIPKDVLSRLSAAARWLNAMLDPVSGHVPNLGHNDGSLLLPVGCSNYGDFRPTAQAASRAFLGHACLPPGEYDELSIWLGLTIDQSKITTPSDFQSAAIKKVGDHETWATIRGVHFNERPAHADQLHVDIWHKGHNIALDAGTYLYNAAPPWENSLAGSAVHNTICVDGQDQMIRAGRFLWLDQAQAKWEHTSRPDSLRVSHDGYNRIGIHHTRCLAWQAGEGFSIRDELVKQKLDDVEHEFVLHWLLPDASWIYKNDQITLSHQGQEFMLKVTAATHTDNLVIKPSDVSIIKAGQTLLGERSSPILGWESKVYNQKQPSLSFSVTFKSRSSINLFTDWNIKDG